MPEEVYEVIALGARYWFALLGVLIVWRAFSWLRKDRRAKHRRLKRLPDAGFIGEWVVLLGSDELPEGSAIPVPWEGVMGFLRTCDVVVPVPGVANQHLDFSFRNGKGLVVTPLRGRDCIVDGVTLTHRTRTARCPLHHGSRLQLGDAILRLRLFAGLETDRRASLQPDMACEPLPFPDDPVPPQDWRQNTGAYQPPTWQPGAGTYQPPVNGGWQQPYAPQPWQTPPQPSVEEQVPYAPPQDVSWTQGGAPEPYRRSRRSGRGWDDDQA